MNKFLLIDHSIRDVSGHYYEYALRVLSAARDMGYTPILATNRRFKNQVSPLFETYPIYRARFWSAPEESRLVRLYKAISTTLGDWFTRLKAGLIFSGLGLTWLRREHPAQVLKNTPEVGSAEIASLAGIYLFKGATASLDVLRELLPFKTYLKSVFNALKKFLSIILAPIIIPLRLPRWLAQKLADQRKQRSFTADTLRLLKKISFEENDIIFIPTLAEPELLALLKVFRTNPKSHVPNWHVLFRRNIFQGRDPDYASEQEELRLQHNAFQKFRQQKPARAKVFFHTDTAQLTDQYDRLGMLRFSTLPIPVHAAFSQSQTGSPSYEPYRIISAGDARTEKGYPFFPKIVADLWEETILQKQISFHLQSNFNIPNGEAAVRAALAQLQDYPPDCVEIIPGPLSQEEYRRLILSASILPIPYDASNYYARSSGILVEALSAAIPVIVPSGTWMACQLAPYITAYHKHLPDQYPVIHQAALSDITWFQEGRSRPIVTPDDSLYISGRGGSFTYEIPTGATHLLYTFTQPQNQRGFFVEIQTTLRDELHRRLAVKTNLIGGTGGETSALISLPRQTRFIHALFKGAYSQNPGLLKSLRLTFLSTSADLPLAVGGMLYADPLELSACIKEIIAHYPAYRASANELAAGVRAYHNPHTLVKCLQDAQ